MSTERDNKHGHLSSGGLHGLARQTVQHSENLVFIFAINVLCEKTFYGLFGGEHVLSVIDIRILIIVIGNFSELVLNAVVVLDVR